MNSELPNKIIRLMSSFISDRTITVKINDEMSDKVKLIAGTPQGSVLSPLLFFIYVNNIPVDPMNNQVKISQFADDLGMWTFGGGGPRVVVSTAAFHARVRGSVPGLGSLKETKLFLPHPRVKVSIVGSLRDREVACSASDLQGSNFESCVWRTVSSQSSHHPQEVLLAQFSLYVHKGGLKPDSFHFICGHSAPTPHTSNIGSIKHYRL